MRVHFILYPLSKWFGENAQIDIVTHMKIQRFHVVLAILAI